MMAKKTFAERLKALREAAGLTQATLADRAGMNSFGVAKLEQGVREPTWATVQSLCKALGVGCDAFLDDAGDDPQTDPASHSMPKRRQRRKGASGKGKRN
jgi:transcriptional regulator with XRE-family HTH domain